MMLVVTSFCCLALDVRKSHVPSNHVLQRA